MAEIVNTSTLPEPSAGSGAFADRSERVRCYRERAGEILVLAEESQSDEQRRAMIAIAAMYNRLAEHFERGSAD